MLYDDADVFSVPCSCFCHYLPIPHHPHPQHQCQSERNCVVYRTPTQFLLPRVTTPVDNLGEIGTRSSKCDQMTQFQAHQPLDIYKIGIRDGVWLPLHGSNCLQTVGNKNTKQKKRLFEFKSVEKQTGSVDVAWWPGFYAGVLMLMINSGCSMLNRQNVWCCNLQEKRRGGW